MRELSDRKITGTKDSAFRVVTGLLYEAVSGQPDADLKRACDSVLQNVNFHQVQIDPINSGESVPTNSAESAKNAALH